MMAKLAYINPYTDARRYINVNYNALHEALKRQAPNDVEILGVGDKTDADFVFIQDHLRYYRGWEALGGYWKMRPVDYGSLEAVKGMLLADIHPFLSEEMRRRRIGMIRGWNLSVALGPYFDHPLVRRFKDRLRCRFQLFPWWVDQETFYPGKGERDIDATFIGRMGRKIYPLRQIIDWKLRKAKDITYRTYPHPGYVESPDPRRYVFGKSYADVLRRSKIHIFGNSVYRYPVNKYFEAMACGALVLAPIPIGGGEQHLQPWVNFIPIEVDNFMDRVRYYLENEEERMKVARRGCEMVHRHHTAEVRARSLLEIVEEYVQ